MKRPVLLIDQLNQFESIDAPPPPGKKMKTIKTTRTFYANGYQND